VVASSLALVVGGLFGISLKKMFKNPFGKHSLFGKATQIASVLPIPGGGLIGKAFGLLNRANRGYTELRGRVGPILTAAGAASLIPATAPVGVMPGGAQASGPARPTTRRKTSRRRTTKRRKRRRTTRRR
jgi:hypothetical protein